jgi:hypothetical protein
MFGRQLWDPYAEPFTPELCHACTRGDHDKCDGTLWSTLLDFPATCECDPDLHEQDPHA